MRIAFIGQKEFPATGREIDRHIEKLAVRLTERGNDVFSYIENCHNGKNLFSSEGVKFVRVSGFGMGRMKMASHFLLTALKIIFKRYDIIHIQGIEPSLFVAILPILKRRTVFISTFHTRSYLRENRSRLEKKLLELSEKIFFDISEKITTTSQDLQKYASAKYKRNVIRIPAGPSLKYDSSTKSLERWGLKDKKYILAEIKPEKEKMAEKIINAFKRLEDTGKISNGFKLLLLGDNRMDNKQKKIIKKMIQGKKSIIFTANQTRSSLEQLFSHAYLFIQPFESEETPMRLIEAMNCAAAPLVCESHSNLEVIGKCGLSFNPKSSENIEEMMSLILNKPEEAVRIGKLASERIRKEFSWESITKKTLRIYESSLEGKEKEKLSKLVKKAESYV